MVVRMHNFYMFDRKGTSLLYHEWSREHNPLADNMEEDAMLVFGLLFSLKKELAQKLAPKPPATATIAQAGASGVGAGAADPNAAALAMAKGTTGNLTSFSTNNFTLHQLETASGLRLVLNTSKCGDHLLRDVQNALRHVYAELFVNIVVKNPLYEPGARITNPVFIKQLDSYMLGMSSRLV